MNGVRGGKSNRLSANSKNKLQIIIEIKTTLNKPSNETGSALSRFLLLELPSLSLAAAHQINTHRTLTRFNWVGRERLFSFYLSFLSGLLTFFDIMKADEGYKG